VHVIVVGCGRVGSGLAAELEREGHDVAIVDKTPGSFRRLPQGWRGQKVLGFGFDRGHLEEAGAKHADALAAVTSGDNSNILTARIARETYEIPNVVARIYDPRRAEIFQRLGIPTVPSVTWTIDQVFSRILPGQASFDWTDSSGRLHIVERTLPAAWAGKRIAQAIEQSVSEKVKLAAVCRAGDPITDVESVVGQEGDLLLLILPRESEDDFRRLFSSDDMRATHPTTEGPGR
jgi:trk system potassium uptake protein TrkA